MERTIIGREKEKMELKKYVSSEQSEFVAIYGRRRVGKTFLVKELLEGKFTFRMTGKEKANLSTNSTPCRTVPRKKSPPISTVPSTRSIRRKNAASP